MPTCSKIRNVKKPPFTVILKQWLCYVKLLSPSPPRWIFTKNMTKDIKNNHENKYPRHESIQKITDRMSNAIQCPKNFH